MKYQLSGIDPAEILVPFTNAEISPLWAENEHWQRPCSNFLGEISNKYSKSKKHQFIRRISWILSHIVLATPISGALTFYTDGNNTGKADYKSGKISKVAQSPKDPF